MAKYKVLVHGQEVEIQADSTREAALKLRALRESAKPLPEEADLTPA